MTRQQTILLAAGAAALLILVPGAAGALTTAAGAASFLPEADQFITSWEQFSATPYWDVSRYSWGYGTAAPGATGTISQEQALQDANAEINANYAYLAPMIIRPLTPSQWAALMSFAYNEGQGNADNLVANINSGNDTALGQQWNLYVYAGGVVNSNLVSRRAAEWRLWQS